jgi:hypothetical protein
LFQKLQTSTQRSEFLICEIFEIACGSGRCFLFLLRVVIVFLLFSGIGIEAKKFAVRDLYDLTQLAVNLPWSADHYNETVKVMGEDFWPYGFNENLHTLKTFLRYHHDQGISKRLVRPEELFAESTFDLSKI